MFGSLQANLFLSLAFLTFHSQNDLTGSRSLLVKEAPPVLLGSACRLLQLKLS